jgi:hypothetical protein
MTEINDECTFRFNECSEEFDILLDEVVAVVLLKETVHHDVLLVELESVQYVALRDSLVKYA